MVPVHGVCVFDPGLSSFMCQNCPLILVKRIRKTLFKITALGVMAVGMDGGDGAELWIQQRRLRVCNQGAGSDGVNGWQVTKRRPQGWGVSYSTNPTGFLLKVGQKLAYQRWEVSNLTRYQGWGLLPNWLGRTLALWMRWAEDRRGTNVEASLRTGLGGPLLKFKERVCQLSHLKDDFYTASSSSSFYFF